jgi:hypothetical protein
MTSRHLFLTLLCCSACGFGDKSGDAQVSFSGDSAANAITLGPGDVKVTSSGNALVLAVIGDSVRMQLSDSLRNSVKQELDTAGGDSKLASAIVKSVGGVVNSALGFSVRVHVNDIENLRYEDGSIRFEVRGGNVNLKTGKHSMNDAAFSEADARRFIEAVERRQQRTQDIAR